MSKKDFWIGIGVGTAVGLGAGFVVGNIVTKRAARRDIERIRKQAYLKGRHDVESEVIIVDGADPDKIKEAIEKTFDGGEKEEKSSEDDDENSHSKPISEENRTKTSNEGEKSALIEEKSSDFLTDNAYGVSDLPSNISKALPVRFDGNSAIFIGAAGTELRYPKSLIIDPNTNTRYNDLRIRTNFRSYEDDISRLRLIWTCMGWGTYVEALDGVPTDEDIDNWDVSIGDESQLGSEPEEATERRRKYMNALDDYIANPNAGPCIISEKDFGEETHLEQLYFDYYPVDNVFVQNDDIGTPVDAFTLFGTNNGKEIFEQKTVSEEDPDPDIVHMRNFKMNCVMEITRYPGKSYAGVKDGTAYT